MVLETSCIGDDYLTCQSDVESECVGTANSQYVYHLKETIGNKHKDLYLNNSRCHKETMVVCGSSSNAESEVHSTQSINPATTMDLPSMVSSTQIDWNEKGVYIFSLFSDPFNLLK